MLSVDSCLRNRPGETKKQKKSENSQDTYHKISHLSTTLPCGAAKLLLSRANESIILKQQNPNKILLFGVLSLSFDTKSMENRSAFDDKNDIEPVRTGIRINI